MHDGEWSREIYVWSRHIHIKSILCIKVFGKIYFFSLIPSNVMTYEEKHRELTK
jgi:hypothetical protein